MYSVQEIQQLKEFFATANVPDEFELSQGVRVAGSKKFIASHLAVLDNPAQWGVHCMFIERLKMLKSSLQTK